MPTRFPQGDNHEQPVFFTANQSMLAFPAHSGERYRPLHRRGAAFVRRFSPRWLVAGIALTIFALYFRYRTTLHTLPVAVSLKYNLTKIPLFEPSKHSLEVFNDIEADSERPQHTQRRSSRDLSTQMLATRLSSCISCTDLASNASFSPCTTSTRT